MTSVSHGQQRAQCCSPHSDPAFHHFHVMQVAKAVKSAVFPGVSLCSPSLPWILSWRPAHFTSKNWGRRRKWWQGTRVNNEKTPAANTAHLPVCFEPQQTLKMSQGFIFNICVGSPCLLKSFPLLLGPLICSLALQWAGPAALPAAVPRSLKAGVSFPCLSKCCSLCQSNPLRNMHRWKQRKSFSVHKCVHGNTPSFTSISLSSR